MVVKLLIGFIIFLLLIVLIEYFRKKRLHEKPGEKHTNQPAGQSKNETESCCGLHNVCIKNKLSKASDKNIEYYDDEELDVYKGRSSNGYMDQETEKFLEILHTMLKKDIPGWKQSLLLRDINLPDKVKTEISNF